MLQYASLKAVLQYLDANIRFEIYNRCPSIQKAERAVPLYINSLEFIPGVNRPNRILVNSTEYNIGTIRVYSSGAKIPHAHDAENMKGGVESDIDKFGFKDYTSDTHLTPGDILVGRLRRARQLNENQIDARIEKLEALDVLLALKREGKPFISDIKHPQFEILQQFKNQEVEVIRKEMEDRKLALSPYLNRRNNTTVPYTTEIQMTVTRRRRESEREYRYPGRKLYQVEKKLLTMFFGSRKHIYVKSLGINNAKMFRFPVDMLIKIQNLGVTRYTLNGFNAISQFVHPMSVPLKTIRLRSFEGKIKHTIAKSARNLVILGLCRHMPTFLEVVTQKIVKIERPDFNPEDYLILARNWLETRRTVGTCYVFNLDEEYELAELMRLLETELNAEAVRAQCLEVRINETSNLRISYRKGLNSWWRMQFKVISE